VRLRPVADQDTRIGYATDPTVAGLQVLVTD
jgi:hypothetical protein